MGILRFDRSLILTILAIMHFGGSFSQVIYGQGRSCNDIDIDDYLRDGKIVKVFSPPDILVDAIRCYQIIDWRINRLLEAGADPNAIRSDGVSALQMAVAVNSWMVTSLLDAGANPNMHAGPNDAREFARSWRYRFSSGFTPLKIAIIKGDLSVVQVLLAHGADPNLRGYTAEYRWHDGTRVPVPGHLAESPIERAVKGGDSLPMIGALLNAGADPNTLTSAGVPVYLLSSGLDLFLNAGANPNLQFEGFGDRQSPLTYQIRRHRLIPSIERLLTGGADPNVVFPGGRYDYSRTPLIEAISGGRNDFNDYFQRLVETLLTAGADPNLEVPLNFTAHQYQSIESAEMLRVLLEAGADPNGRNDKVEKIPLSTILGRFTREATEHQEPLQHLLEGVRILIEFDVDLNVLLSYDYDDFPNAQYSLHRTLQSMPSQESKRQAEHLELISDLLEGGADPNIISREDEWGLYPLALAKNGTVATALLSAGANPNIVDSNGYSPLHHAGSGDVVRALIDAGANPNAIREREGAGPAASVLYNAVYYRECLNANPPQIADTPSYDYSCLDDSEWESVNNRRHGIGIGIAGTGRCYPGEDGGWNHTLGTCVAKATETVNALLEGGARVNVPVDMQHAVNRYEGALRNKLVNNVGSSGHQFRLDVARRTLAALAAQTQEAAPSAMDVDPDAVTSLRESLSKRLVQSLDENSRKANLISSLMNFDAVRALGVRDPAQLAERIGQLDTRALETEIDREGGDASGILHRTLRPSISLSHLEAAGGLVEYHVDSVTADKDVIRLLVSLGMFPAEPTECVKTDDALQFLQELVWESPKKCVSTGGFGELSSIIRQWSPDLDHARKVQLISDARVSLENGADPNSVISEPGLTSLHRVLLTRSRHRMTGKTYLDVRFDTHTVEMVKLLLEHGADPNLPYGKYDSVVLDFLLGSLIPRAVAVDLLEMLLESGADPDRVRSGFTRLLFHSSFRGVEKNERDVLRAARVLLDHGADRNSILQAVVFNVVALDRTVKDWASIAVDMVKLFRDAGVSIAERDSIAERLACPSEALKKDYWEAGVDISEVAQLFDVTVAGEAMATTVSVQPQYSDEGGLSWGVVRKE